MNQKKYLDEEYQEIIEEIEKNSSYKKLSSDKRESMSVLEMRKLLGLGKTDGYWLVKKNFFESNIILGKIRIDIASFEQWYANQVKYQKVTGEEPGKELKKRSYSPQEIAELLGITVNNVYDVLKRYNMETITVDYLKRVPKKVFEEWYVTQSRYRTKEDREKEAGVKEATISMPEMARLLGVNRRKVYSIINKYSDLIDTIVVADQRRVTKESFEKFLDSQSNYQLAAHNDYKEVALEGNVAVANYRRRKLMENNERKGNGNLEYLTISEAALIAKVGRSTVSSWISRNKFPVKRMKQVVRIPRREFETWLKRRAVEMEG